MGYESWSTNPDENLKLYEHDLSGSYGKLFAEIMAEIAKLAAAINDDT